MPRALEMSAALLEWSALKNLDRREVGDGVGRVEGVLPDVRQRRFTVALPSCMSLPWTQPLSYHIGVLGRCRMSAATVIGIVRADVGLRLACRRRGSARSWVSSIGEGVVRRQPALVLSVAWRIAWWALKPKPVGGHECCDVGDLVEAGCGRGN